MAVWIKVDCGEMDYQRELWIRRWRETMQHFFGATPVCDWNGKTVMWGFLDEELGAKMATTWTLEAKGYRTSYQSKVKTFFWVDLDFYKQNRRAILEFAERYGCKVPNREYGWIEMPNDRVEMLFRLQWAGKCCG